MKKLTSIVAVFAFLFSANMVSAQQQGGINNQEGARAAQAARSSSSNREIITLGIAIVAAVAGIAVAVSSNTNDSGYTH